MRREPPVRIREGLGVKFPRATRLVILCRRPEEAARALETVQQGTAEACLTLHPNKTRIVNATSEGFDFLCYRFEGGTRRPRTNSLDKLKDTIRAKTKRTSGESLRGIIDDVNRTLRAGSSSSSTAIAGHSPSWTNGSG